MASPGRIEVVILTVPAGEWHRLDDRLARIERALGITERELRNDMSEIDDKLAAEGAALTALEADEARELADLQALKDAGQTLTADQEARFDSLTARITAADAAIDTADPAPAPPTA